MARRPAWLPPLTPARPEGTGVPAQPDNGTHLPAQRGYLPGNGRRQRLRRRPGRVHEGLGFLLRQRDELGELTTPGQVGVELPPTFAGNPGHGWSTLGGWGLFVNPYSRNQRAALTFIKWLAGPQAQRILATEFSQIPANASIRDDQQITDHNPVLSAAKGAWVVARPATTSYPATTKVISSNIHAALPSQGSAGTDPCTALVHAAEKLDPQVRGGLNCGRSPPVSEWPAWTVTVPTASARPRSPGRWRRGYPSLDLAERAGDPEDNARGDPHGDHRLGARAHHRAPGRAETNDHPISGGNGSGPADDTPGDAFCSLDATPGS